MQKAKLAGKVCHQGRTLNQRETLQRTRPTDHGSYRIFYGDYRIRTDDPLLAKQVLYQLS
jgi:hypothetical protein